MMERPDYFRNADGIRGFACLLVLFIHATGAIFPSTAPYLPGTGKIGVWLFFVLSAFLLTNHLLLRGTNLRSLADYVLARSFRIIPLFVLSVGFYYVAGTAGIDTHADVLAALTMTKGYAHLWTVPVEMKFYALLYPLTMALMAVCARAGAVWSVAVLVVIGVAFAPTLPLGAAPENSPDLRWYVPCFLMGVFCAIVYPSTRRELSSAVATVISTTIIVIMIALTDGIRRTYIPDSPASWMINQFTLLGGLWAVFIWVNLDDAGTMGKLLSSGPLNSVGRWSYPIYLFHWFFVMKGAQVAQGSGISFIAAISLAIATGAVLHVCIEKPLMGIRKKISVLLGRQP